MHLFKVNVNKIIFFRDQFKVLLSKDHFYIDKDRYTYIKVSL